MVEEPKEIDKILSLSQRQLLALIRLAVTGESSSVLEVCKIDWNAIYELSTKQSVVGIAFAGIERLQKSINHKPSTINPQIPDMDLLMEWLGQAEFIKTQNEVIDRRCVDVRKLFAENGFRTAIMKGQGNGRLYKVDCLGFKVEGDNSDNENSINHKPSSINLSSLRTSGDIDLWVEGTFKKINAFVQNVAPTNEINELEIQFKYYDDAPLEVHYKPFFMRNPWKNRLLLNYLNEEADNCFESKDGFTTLRFNRIHQLVHIHHHLMTEGIGLRQIMDYYFVLRASAKDSMWPQQKIETMEIARQLGLKRFTSALMWVLQQVFEPAVSEFQVSSVSCNKEDEKLETRNQETASWMLCNPNEKDGIVLLKEVMQSGNFGHSDERAQGLKNSSIYRLFIRNLRLMRFDPWDILWGPLWRIYHRLWRMVKGYK